MILINNFRICFMLALVCAAGIAPSLTQDPPICHRDGKKETCEVYQLCLVDGSSKSGQSGCTGSESGAPNCPEDTGEAIKCVGGKCCCKSKLGDPKACNADLESSKEMICGPDGPATKPTDICGATESPGPSGGGGGGSGGGGGGKKCRKGNGTEAPFVVCTAPDHVCLAKNSMMYEGCVDKSMCPNASTIDGTCKNNICCCEPMGEMGCNITGSAHRFLEGHYGGFSLVAISAILIFVLRHKSTV